MVLSMKGVELEKVKISMAVKESFIWFLKEPDWETEF